MALDPMTGEPWKAGNWWHWWGVMWKFIGLDYSILSLAASYGLYVVREGKA